MDQDKLYTLALRLAIHPGTQNVKDPQLLVESLPEPLAVPLPFPENYTLIGSVISSPDYIQIFLDVQGNSDEEVRDFYQRELPAAGWQLPEDGMHSGRGGFTHSLFNFLSYTYNPDWSLSVSVSSGPSNTTEVRLTLNQDKQAYARRRRLRPGPDMFAIFPPLTAPAGALQQGGGGGSSGDQVTTQATVQLKEVWVIGKLYEHYTDQLRNAGWRFLQDEQSAHAAWSSWQFTDKDGEEWNAAFYLFALPEKPNYYQLSLRADLRDLDA